MMFSIIGARAVSKGFKTYTLKIRVNMTLEVIQKVSCFVRNSTHHEESFVIVRGG